MAQAYDQYKELVKKRQFAEAARLAEFEYQQGNRSNCFWLTRQAAALTRAGEYRQALTVARKALTLEPNYTPAIEYRGEAYLGLNRVDDAKRAYESLTEKSAEHAAELLEAMRKWVEMRRANPEGVSTKTVNETERWIEQHAIRAADKVGHASPGQKKSW